MLTFLVAEAFAQSIRSNLQQPLISWIVAIL